MSENSHQSLSIDFMPQGLTDVQKRAIHKYRHSATEIKNHSNFVTYHYQSDRDLPNSFPTVAEYLLKNKKIGQINGLTNPLWGNCQNCASQYVFEAIHRERNELGTAHIRCGACGETGVVYFYINNGNEPKGGWIKDLQEYTNKSLKYRVFHAKNRCFKLRYPNSAKFFDITNNVPCKKQNTLINNMIKPNIWAPDDSTDRIGRFLTDAAMKRWLDEDYNPHDKIDFSRNSENIKIHSEIMYNDRASPGP